MELLFSPIRINQLTIPNRFVRSATHEGLADENGLATPALCEALARLAANEVGLIISGHAFISSEGRASALQLAADRDECIPALQEMTDAVHQAGGKIFLQLAHAGGSAGNPETAMGPSSFSPNPGKIPPCREMSVADIAALIKRFADAAERARIAGFDGVQIHAAHGYCISQFLSGYYNKRSDIYGVEKSRLLFEVYDAIRERVGRMFPITIKINAEDFIPDGMTSDESFAICCELVRRGIDAIELSGGIPQSGMKLSPVRVVNPDSIQTPAYYEHQARRLTSAVPVPVMLVGGIRYPETAERLLSEQCCSMIALSRPLIREPELIRRWHMGDRRRADCVTCNRCFRPILKGQGFFCPVRQELG